MRHLARTAGFGVLYVIVKINTSLGSMEESARSNLTLAFDNSTLDWSDA